jgi:hypothetical protein
MSDPITDLKRELLAAAERQREQAAVPDGRRRLRTRSRRNRLLASGAILSVAAPAVLVFTAPWSNSPNFLARANAALTLKGRVLYMKSETTSTSTDPPCTITLGPDEIWIDQTPPYRFRALSMIPNAPSWNTDARVLACASGTRTEVGGPLNGRVVRFVPPNTLEDVAPVPHLHPSTGPRSGAARSDPHRTCARRRQDNAPWAHGRTDPHRPPRPPNCAIPCPRWPTYVYVDPDRFHPVEIRSLNDIDLDNVNVVRVKLVTRYLRFD